MKKTLLAIALIIACGLSSATPSNKVDIYNCGAITGASMNSIEKHKVELDGYRNVRPVVVVDSETMIVIWGASETMSAEIRDKLAQSFKATIIYRSSSTIIGAWLDADSTGSALQVYSLDIKRGYLYMSKHSEGTIVDVSGAGMFVTKCSKQ